MDQARIRLTSARSIGRLSKPSAFAVDSRYVRRPDATTSCAPGEEHSAISEHVDDLPADRVECAGAQPRDEPTIASVSTVREVRDSRRDTASSAEHDRRTAAVEPSPSRSRSKNRSRKIAHQPRIFARQVASRPRRPACLPQERRVRRDQPVAAREQAGGLGGALGGGAEDRGGGVVRALLARAVSSLAWSSAGSTRQRPSPAAAVGSIREPSSGASWKRS